MAASPTITPARPRDAERDAGLGASRRRRPVLRLVVTWLTSAATLMLLSALLSRVDVDSFGPAVVAVGLTVATTAIASLLAIDDNDFTHPDEALGYLGASPTEASGNDSVAARTVRGVTRTRSVGGEVRLGGGGGDGDGSGADGPALRDHPGVGFLLVRSEERGAMVVGRSGTNDLDEDRVDGDDPLAPFGPNPARHVRPTDGFPHCPDMVVNSAYRADLDGVAAFEELVGSHGGMGGMQSSPFVLHPGDLDAPEQELVGA
ncbi:MAG: hypothetical protein QOG77_2325, partial [Solirubrobacteraceae bacterium]|nr:hypothetical protein [Solirubrobacteraceae bacterium]